MKALITGVAGFIGSSLTDSLLADGAEVVGLDSFDDFYDPAVKRANIAAASGHHAFRLIEEDFRRGDVFARLVAETRPDVVVHLGARAGVRPSLEKAPLYADVNLSGTTHVLEACRRHRVERLVFASSSSVYGKREAEPFSEEDNADRPVSPYAATKRGGELLCYTYHQLFGTHISCLRFFTAYGPRQRPEMAIHAFTRAVDRGEPIHVYGDGSARRDFTYISDVVAGVRAAMERSKGYRIYNLGAGATVELRRVIALIERSLGRKARIERHAAEPADVPNTYADISRAREELGYAPRVSIEEGIDRFVDWYRKSQRDRR